MRAVHIEVVPKLQTDSCFKQIVQFFDRIGKPKTIISDTGTKFVRSERQFSKYVAIWNKKGLKNI